VPFLAVEGKYGFTLFDAEELVNVWVNLIAYLLIWLQAHNHKLSVLAREQDLPEVPVGKRLLLNGPDISRHDTSSEAAFEHSIAYGPG
jgi:hypothetical protein